jgi:hypothetical protein
MLDVMPPQADDSDAALPQSPGDTLHNEVADALARGLITPAEVAGLTHEELAALQALCQQAQAVGDYLRAHRLVLALIVLSPYWATGWSLLAALWRKQHQGAKAAYAEQAARLLTPVQQPEPERPAQAAVALDPTQDTAKALVLRDGRTLPLRHTPAALHHDTVTARIAAQALLGHDNHSRTARWAQGAPPEEGAPITQTSIVRLRGSPQGPVPSGAAGGEGGSDVTSKIPARAAARRLSGWPVTDSWSLGDLTDPASPLKEVL